MHKMNLGGNVVVLDGEEDKTMGICLEERFRHKVSSCFVFFVT